MFAETRDWKLFAVSIGRFNSRNGFYRQLEGRRDRGSCGVTSQMGYQNQNSNGRVLVVNGAGGNEHGGVAQDKSGGEWGVYNIPETESFAQAS